MHRNNKEISVYLCDKEIECCTFNIIQHHSTSFNIIEQSRTMTQTKTFCFIEAEINNFRNLSMK